MFKDMNFCVTIFKNVAFYVCFVIKIFFLV